MLAAALLSSCAGENSASATPDINAILTAGVGTLAASIFQTQTALVPPATETPVPTAIPTQTPIPLISPTVSPTQIVLYVPVTASLIPSPTGTYYTPTANPSTLGNGSNNLELLRDETIPAGTVLNPGEDFTKTWKVANIGTCDWVYLYQLVFVSGEQMRGEPPHLGKVIPPGKWTQLSVSLTAPDEPGTYTSYWQMSNGGGQRFGSLLGVSIVVKAPAPTDTSAPPTDTPTPTPTP